MKIFKEESRGRATYSKRPKKKYFINGTETIRMIQREIILELYSSKFAKKIKTLLN